MEDKGILTAISRNYQSGRWQVVLEVPRISEELQKLQGKEIRAKLTRWTEKRSLDANSYYWVLCGKIAEATHSTNQIVHNIMLQRYGQLEIVDGAVAWRVLPEGQEPSDDEYLKATPNLIRMETKAGKPTFGRVYLVMRGSSTYDTAEMSRLIDGVVEEAQALGIETIPPAELERMVGQWQPKE